MRTLTIDRTKWIRGEGHDRSALLRPDNRKMCCLGFDAISRGYTEEEILDIKTPHRLPLAELKFPEFCYYRGLGYAYHLTRTDLLDKIMMVNDEQEREEVGRETLLTDLFKEAGIQLEFIN
jgi:hypothetical protein